MPKQPMINDALRLLRLYCGLSQTQLAAELGVSQSMMSYVEASRKRVSMDLLEKYSDSLDVRMSQLLFFAEEIEDQDIKSRGRLIIADKVLKLLEKLKPSEIRS